MYRQHIILDFEMNPVMKGNRKASKGLKREIIEIGAVKLDEEYKEVSRFQCFVKPQYNSDIDPGITGLTGITSADVHRACLLKDTLDMFSEWIGEGARIYSWSDNDLLQLKKECMCKGIQMPANMLRWLDFQLLYPRLMNVGSQRKKMALGEAAAWYGISINTKKVHRALYDAEITTELVIPVLSGRYKVQVAALGKNIVSGEKKVDSVCLGELCANIFAQFLQNTEPEFVR